MTNNTLGSNFDKYATQYDEALNRGLSLTGETKNFFADGRLKLVQTYFNEIGFCPKNAIDFGCGTGTNTEKIKALWPSCQLTGIDTSIESLNFARVMCKNLDIHFTNDTTSIHQKENNIDWIFTNGVFHHIPPEKRAEVFQSIFSMIKPGGIFTLFENNPFNLGTHLIMSRVPFDKGVKLLNPYKVRKTLALNGFEKIRLRFAFIFPHLLAPFRSIEPLISDLPFGGQYGVFGMKR